MSEYRRGLLMQYNGDEPEQYIQDGLIMYLDCLDMANCRNGYWHSDINNITFNGNVQYSERGFKFNGPNSGTYLKSNSTFANILSNVKYSLEVVYEPVNMTNWGVLFCDGDWNSFEIMCAMAPTNKTILTWIDRSFSPEKNGLRFGLPSNFNLTQICTFSSSFNGDNSSNKLGYINKQNLSLYNGGATDASHGSTMYIGARNPITTGIFTGYIKAIRLYNRPLTSDEMLYNQDIDVKRYNIII